MRLLATALFPLMLMSCTSSELKQLFPPDDHSSAPVPAGAVTVIVENPGPGGTACDTLNVALILDGAQVAQSPDLLKSGKWSRGLSVAELTGKSLVQLRATCVVTVAGVGGAVITQNGYSVSGHPVTPTAQMLTVTGPRAKPNLAGRVEWATPVPGVLPLDP